MSGEPVCRTNAPMSAEAAPEDRIFLANHYYSDVRRDLAA